MTVTSVKKQTWARAEVAACMAENQDRAEGWSGQRSTTVCLASGECSSSCLQEEIREVNMALTFLLSQGGSKGALKLVVLFALVKNRGQFVALHNCLKFGVCVCTGPHL